MYKKNMCTYIALKLSWLLKNGQYCRKILKEEKQKWNLDFSAKYGSDFCGIIVIHVFKCFGNRAVFFCWMWQKDKIAGMH